MLDRCDISWEPSFIFLFDRNRAINSVAVFKYKSVFGPRRVRYLINDTSQGMQNITERRKKQVGD